jgi:hypothetical protein
MLLRIDRLRYPVPASPLVSNRPCQVKRDYTWPCRDAQPSRPVGLRQDRDLILARGRSRDGTTCRSADLLSGVHLQYLGAMRPTATTQPGTNVKPTTSSTPTAPFQARGSGTCVGITRQVVSLGRYALHSLKSLDVF